MKSRKRRNPYWQDVAQDKKVQTTCDLNFASWNVRTMLDRDRVDRPERRSAIITRELRKYSVDICALSEVRFGDTGSIREEAGYTIYWSGRTSGRKSESGVALAISNAVITKMSEDPKPVNDRIITLRLPLNGERFCSIIAIYAPTMTNSPNTILQFYKQLENILKPIPKDDKIVLLGDFNARVGENESIWNGVLGKFGTGRANSNGELLLSICTEHQLVITNTCFKHKPAHKNSWMHPRSKHWHLIDFIITRQRDIGDFHDTRAVRGANCSTDHIMIRAKTRLRVRRLIRRSRLRLKKLDVGKLKCGTTRDELESQLNEKLPNLSGTVEDKWASFKSTVYEVSKDTLGFVERKHADWFDGNDSELSKLIENRNQARAEMLNRNTRSTKARFKQHSRLLQKRCRELKNEWWQSKAAELQVLADMNDTRGFHQGLKAVWGPRVNYPDQLLSSDNQTLLSEKKDLLSRWTEHFNSLLNESNEVPPDVTRDLKQHPVQSWMDELPDLKEVADAISLLSSGKSPGSDGIHPEVIKLGGKSLVQCLHEIILDSWKSGTPPQDWKDAQLITLFKKGDRRLCGNYRGISLLSIPGKVYARILLNRLSVYAETLLPEAQCGFRAGRGTVDMIFSLKQVQEKCIEQQMPLYMVFVDFTKAFDTVNRSALWSILRKLGCPDHFTSLIASLHQGMKASVSLKGELSEPFSVNNGVKQGCVLAPTLFSLYLTVVLNQAFKDHHQGVVLQCRPGADLFNVSQFKSSRSTTGAIVRELMFADDIAFVAHSHADAQDIITRFADSARIFGLKINIKKTEVMYQPPPGSTDPGLDIQINGENLNNVKNFKYLGTTVSDNNKHDAELELRISNASKAFGRLRDRVWQNKDLTIKTKCAVYRAIVLSTLLYGVEAWVVYRVAAHRLSVYMMRHLRQILNINWRQHISNTKILEITELPSMYDTLINRCLRWTGHVNRLSNNRLPKLILYSQLAEGTRGIGRPKLRYKDTIKRNLKDKDIPLGSWQKLSTNRADWRRKIRARDKSSSDSMDS